MPALTLTVPVILSMPVAGLTALAVLIGASTDVTPNNSTPGLTGGSVCATSGPLAGMSAAQAQNARVVAATASARAGDRAALIAVMTGLAESGLRVLANPNDPSGNQLPNQGVGHDHDSLGIFQQRASWGTAEQRRAEAERVAELERFDRKVASLRQQFGSARKFKALAVPVVDVIGPVRTNL